MIVAAGEPAGREKLADEIIAFIKTGKPDQSTLTVLTPALPALVSQRHFPELKAILESRDLPVSPAIKNDLIGAIAATRAPEAANTLLDLLKNGQYLCEASETLSALGANAAAADELKKLLPQIPRQDPRRWAILDSLRGLGDDSDDMLKEVLAIPDRRAKDEFLPRIRSPKVIPILLAQYDEKDADAGRLDTALRTLTLEESQSGKAQWQAWWEKNNATFQVLGNSEQDVPKLVKRYVKAQQTYLQSEIMRRLKKWPAAATASLLPLLGSNEGDQARRAAQLLMNACGDTGSQAFADYVTSGKPLTRGSGLVAGPLLIQQAQTPQQVADILAKPGLPESAKAAFIYSVASSRQSTEYLELYKSLIPKVAVSQKGWKWNEGLSVLMVRERGRLGAGLHQLGVGQHQKGGALTRQSCSQKLAGGKSDRRSDSAASDWI